MDCKIIIARKIVNSHGIGDNVMRTWAKVIAANEKDKSETKQKNRSWYQTCKQREKEKPRMTLADTVRHLAQIHPFEETTNTKST